MRLLNLLRETKQELRQVNWPNRRQTISFTTVVIAFSLVIAALLGLFDFGFVSLLESLVF